MKTPADHIAEMRAMLEKRPSAPERAVWAELDMRQKIFILRGLGINPTDFSVHALKAHERELLMACVMGWAGTAERLRRIMKTCRAEQQAEHLRVVASADVGQAPVLAEKKGRAA